jgi:Family of unknown function (DUF6263)
MTRPLLSLSLSPRPKSAVALLIVSATFLASGCKKHEPHQDAGSTPAASAAPSASPSAAPEASAVAALTPPDPTLIAPPTTITVKSTGTGEKQVLRYGFSVGTEKKFTISLSINPKVTVNGQAMPGGGAIQLVVSGKSKIEKVLPDGSAERLLTFEKFAPTAAGAPPEALAQLATQLGALAGLTIRDTVKSNGKTEKLTLVGAAQVPPQAQALIGNLSEGMSHSLFRFPEEPLAVGAEWTETGSINSGGLTVNQTITYRLTKRTGSAVSIQLKSQQTAAPKKLDGAGLPPGSSLELLKLDGRGEGTMEADLTKLDVRSKMKSSLDVDTKAAAPGAPAPMNSKTSTTIDLEVKVEN